MDGVGTEVGGACFRAALRRQATQIHVAEGNLCERITNDIAPKSDVISRDLERGGVRQRLW